MARINIPLDLITSRLNLGSISDHATPQSIRTRFANLKPISEFLDFKRLSKPANFGEIQTRVNYNLGYFSSNYVVVSLMLLIYSLLNNMTLLFDMVFIMTGMFGIKRLKGRDLDVGFMRATTAQLYTGLCVIGIPVFLWSGPVGTALWLVGATGVFFRGGSLGGRLRTPYPTPSQGRPSGGKRRKEWERQRLWEEQHRFEELDSESDDVHNGVELADTFQSDDLQFTGGDMGPRTRYRRKYEYSDHSEDEDGQLDQRTRGELQVAIREKEEVLLKRALQRIRRARELGLKDVQLTPPERDALERKMALDQSKDKRPTLKTRKSSEGRRVGSAPQLPSTSKRKSSRSSLNKTEDALVPVVPPGIKYIGPDGRTMYTPFGHYPSGPSNRLPTASRPHSRSDSSSNLIPRSTPPLLPSSSRHAPKRFTSGPELRRPSSSRTTPSPRPLPDDPDWQPRARSSSNLARSFDHPLQYQAYASPLLPSSENSHQSRRSGANPAEIGYPSLRRGKAARRQEVESESESEEEDDDKEAEGEEEEEADEDDDDDEDDEAGVQVNVVPYGQSYEVAYKTTARKAKHGKR